ncbi:N-acetylmuramoyl-L-alanine amidase [Butyrivibrio sp. WCD3002]|uniref:N-acetylmuramoyl-L-alanine amidase n=1 Tax=Butyrivibrio sp. WCD3002 TaxID=1280676 RepID=UPI000424A018|nr:N-acetylmuramoyl-L-alanine amidase [Butyrivibrio sp. WCD3002]
MKKRKNSPIPYILIGVGVIVLLALVVFAITRDPSGVKDKEETEVAEAQMEASGDSGDTDSVSADDQAGSENGDITMNGSEEAQARENDSLQASQNGEGSSDTADSDESTDGAASENSDTSEENGTSDTLAADSDASATAGDSTDKEASDSENAESSENSNADISGSDSENTSADAAQAQTSTPHTGGHLVVIDPGHQSHGMSEKEPNGPGSSNMKAKVTGGTSGKTSGLTEYQLNLTVGLKLRDELVARGYTVIMTRESNDVSLSNVDRAQIANNAGAEAFVRIHANGSDNTSTNGAMTICQTPSNPYNAAYYSQSRKLSDCVLDSFVAATGCKKQYVWETDTMTGINWANVPSTIIEMGYMSNPTEDANMASEAYQSQMVTGIANGIDAFFAN